MPQMKSARIQDHFADLTDPRRREVDLPPDQCRCDCYMRGDLRCRRFCGHCRVWQDEA